MSGYFSSFLQKIPGFSGNERHSIRIVGRKCTGYAEIQGETAPTFRTLPEHFSVMGGLGTEPELTHRLGVGQFATPRSGIAERRKTEGDLPRSSGASR